MQQVHYLHHEQAHSLFHVPLQLHPWRLLPHGPPHKTPTASKDISKRPASLEHAFFREIASHRKSIGCWRLVRPLQLIGRVLLCFCMSAAHGGRRLSGLQRQVLSLFRRSMRAARDKDRALQQLHPGQPLPHGGWRVYARTQVHCDPLLTCSVHHHRRLCGLRRVIAQPHPACSLRRSVTWASRTTCSLSSTYVEARKHWIYSSGLR